MCLDKWTWPQWSTETERRDPGWNSQCASYSRLFISREERQLTKLDLLWSQINGKANIKTCFHSHERVLMQLLHWYKVTYYIHHTILLIARHTITRQMSSSAQQGLDSGSFCLWRCNVSNHCLASRISSSMRHRPKAADWISFYRCFDVKSHYF